MINQIHTDVVPDIKAAGRLLLARERLLEQARFFTNFAFDFFGFKIIGLVKMGPYDFFSKKVSFFSISSSILQIKNAIRRKKTLKGGPFDARFLK